MQGQAEDLSRTIDKLVGTLYTEKAKHGKRLFQLAWNMVIKLN